MLFPWEKIFFYFTCIGFLAEDSKIDRAMRLFEIFRDDQLIPYINSQNILNLFPMIFLKLKGLVVHFSLEKTHKITLLQKKKWKNKY